MDALRKDCEAKGWDAKTSPINGVDVEAEDGSVKSYKGNVIARGRIRTVVDILLVLEDHGVGKPWCEVCGDTGRLDDIECPGCGGERPR